ncbi:MAG: flavodoxin family protein [Rhodocyclales bacterium]|nr:flavodoxin family protein [Rhodocyclales bacterium]
MTKVAVAYHSGYGHTARQAQAVFEGAQSVPGVEAKLLSVDAMDDAFWGDLADADAIIFGAPTYMGSVSAKFKEFMDASSKAWFAMGSPGWKDKLAAGFTNSASQSGDKLGTLNGMMVFANQHGMIWVSLGLPPGNNSSKGSLDDLNRLGSFSGAMAQSNADQGADTMRDSDLKTAAHLGRRVAETAQQFGA